MTAQAAAAHTAGPAGYMQGQLSLPVVNSSTDRVPLDGQPQTHPRHIFSEMQVTNQQFPEGSASKFYWPVEADSESLSESEADPFRRNQTSVAMQVGGTRPVRRHINRITRLPLTALGASSSKVQAEDRFATYP